MNCRPLLISLFAICVPVLSATAQDSVQYEFEFVSEWSVLTHPTDHPDDGAHYSRVIGATHTDQLSLWEPGGIATTGIEVMAETGAIAALMSEVESHITEGTADQFLSLGRLDFTPGSISSSITASSEFQFLSLVTMLAPSPDWFVGIHDIDLRPGGIWVRELVIDLDPYDAGTDAGTTYRNPNIDITPHLPIINIANDFPFNGGGRIGTFRVTLISDAACSLADFAEPYNLLDFFDVSAFIAAFSSQDSDADLNNDGSFDFFDVSSFINTYSAGCP